MVASATVTTAAAAGDDPQTPKPATTSDFGLSPLPSDLDSLSAQQVRSLIDDRDALIQRLHSQLEDLKSAHSDLLQRSAAWKDELETSKAAVAATSSTSRPSSASSTTSPPAAAAAAAPAAAANIAESPSSSSSSTNEAALRDEVTQLRSANSALEDQVRDLRIRAEESRRAIMRLQNEHSETRAKAKAENRRSMAVSSAASTWNSATLAAMADGDEARELRKSKRASLAFGPNAAGLRTSYASTTATNTSSHRRTASGSSTGTNSAAAGGAGGGMPGVNIDAGSGAESESEADTTSTPALPGFSPNPSSSSYSNGVTRGPTRMSGGLRGLRLSGMFSGSGGGAGAGGTSAIGLTAPGSLDEDAAARSASRRASFNSSAASSSQPARSPISDVGPSYESALSDHGGDAPGSATGLNRNRFSYSGARPSVPNRQSSSSSILSSGTAFDDNLGLPGTAGGSNGSTRPFSVSPSPSLHSKVGSPILEENDGSRPSEVEDETIEANESPRSRFATLTGLRTSNTNTNGGASGRPPLAPALTSMAAQAELQAEVDRLKRELAKAKNAYEEAEEARVASEECLRALKDFIAKHDDEEEEVGTGADAQEGGGESGAAPALPAKDRAGAGAAAGIKSPSTPKNTSTLTAGQTAALKGLKLPPLPSSTETDDDEERTPGPNSIGGGGGGKTPVAPSPAAAAAGAGAASSLWTSSNWSARFSNFPQLIRMSTGASGTSTTSASSAAGAGAGAAGTERDLPLSPAARLSSPPLASARAAAGGGGGGGGEGAPVAERAGSLSAVTSP
ncbi:hypothetical protein OC834_004896 [Tilletia horrida]|nr:hypothetical protein OC834_004896 [Tilletia horrida]